MVIFKKRKRKVESMENKKRKLTISIAENVYKDLEKIAREKGLSKSAVITVALENYQKGGN